jgi:hypothetical protein
MHILKQFLLWLKRQDDSTKSWTEPGGFFDPTTYFGSIKVFIFSLVFLLGAPHIDDFGKWLWRLFGKELIQNPGEEGTHLIVFSALGAFGCVISIWNMSKIYRMRRSRSAFQKPE